MEHHTNVLYLHNMKQLVEEFIVQVQLIFLFLKIVILNEYKVSQWSNVIIYLGGWHRV